MGDLVATPEMVRQLATIRQSGIVNMLDRRGVMDVANGRGYASLYTWVHDCMEDRTYGGAAYRAALDAMAGCELDGEDAS